MELIIDHKPVSLPNGYQSPEDVLTAAARARPPMPVVVQPPLSGETFLVQKRIYLSGACSGGGMMLCENDAELWFACKLVADDHNHWQEFSPEKTLNCLDETEMMEEAVRKHMEEEPDDEAAEDLASDIGWRDY